MIIRKNKGYETNSLFPNSDWYNEGNYVVDETTEEGIQLAKKIIKYYPCYDLIVSDGKLTDIYTYAKVSVKIPSVISANEEIDINIVADDGHADEQGEGKEVVIYIDEEEQVRGILPYAFKLEFEIAGEYDVLVDAGKHGQVYKKVIVQ